MQNCIHFRLEYQEGIAGGGQMRWRDLRRIFFYQKQCMEESLQWLQFHFLKQMGLALFFRSLFFPSILLVLLALTAWLRYPTEFPEERSDGKNRHDPDYIVTQVSGRKLDATGKLLYTLGAEDPRILLV